MHGPFYYYYSSCPLVRRAASQVISFVCEGTLHSIHRKGQLVYLLHGTSMVHSTLKDNSSHLLPYTSAYSTNLQHHLPNKGVHIPTALCQTVIGQAERYKTKGGYI